MYRGEYYPHEVGILIEFNLNIHSMKVVIMPEAIMSDLGQVVETHAMEQEFLWTCTLTSETKEFLWNPEVRLELLA